MNPNEGTMSEQHVDWITDCIAYLRDQGHDCIEATSEAEADWVQHVRDVSNSTLFPLANSWYLGANVPGKPRVFMAYLGVGAYAEKCRDVVAGEYAGFACS
jgi:cyclohexanone monooxygenase